MNAPHDLLPKVAPRPVPAAFLDALRARFGDRCTTALAVREQHGRDESPFAVRPPDAVVFCESTDEVAFVVRLADEHAVPVIPFGVGSSLEGHLLAVQGGVSIDLSRMNRILAVNAADFRFGPLASNSIAALFGTDLAVRTESARSNPLPFSY